MLGEYEHACAALAAHAISVAESAAVQMAQRDHEQPAALWLDAESAAVHRGLLWTLDHNRFAGLRLAVALAPWWHLRARWAEGYTLLQRSVAQTDSTAANWYSAHCWLGELSRMVSDFRLVLSHFSTVVDTHSRDQPSPHLVDGLTGKCSALRNLGRLPEAARDAHMALELAQRIGYRAGEADALQELSYISVYADQPEDAVKWARQAQRVPAQQFPDRPVRQVKALLPWVLVATQQLAGLSNAQQADLEAQCAEALALAGAASLHASAALATQIGFTLRLIDILDEVGFLCSATGHPAEALTLWAALAIQNEATGLADTLQAKHRRESPLREAEQAGGESLATVARSRGAAMTLAAAVEFAVLMTEQVRENRPAPTRGTAPATEPGTRTLSARERELVELVAQGRTDAEIAEQLFISIRTVRTHLDRIRDKSGCRRRADLTRLALQEGIV